jgi:hypothetical protein
MVIGDGAIVDSDLVDLSNLNQQMLLLQPMRAPTVTDHSRRPRSPQRHSAPARSPMSRGATFRL